MARITVNQTGTNPMILISTTDIANVTSAMLANGNFSANANSTNTLSVGCLQDVTITASTGVFSWTDFCSIDTNKITTPADNEVATNIVIDSEKYFGNASASGAAQDGIADLSQNKDKVQFLVIWNSNGSGSGTANIANLITDSVRNSFATASEPIYWSSGVGYITNLAPTASPDAPVWVSPMTIAVDGTLYNGQNT